MYSAHIKAVAVETVETVEEKMIYQIQINQRLIQHPLPSIGNKKIYLLNHHNHLPSRQHNHQLLLL